MVVILRLSPAGGSSSSDCRCRGSRDARDARLIQTMPRGGHRENAGRKRGTPNKATAARQAEVAASGITPLDYMLKVLRDENADPHQRFEAAKSAAPYVHPKLASIQHGN